MCLVLVRWLLNFGYFFWRILNRSYAGIQFVSMIDRQLQDSPYHKSQLNTHQLITHHQALQIQSAN